MPTDRRLDDRISRWLEAEAPTQLPDRALRATFERTRKTRQQFGWRSVLGRNLMNRTFFALGGAAAVLLVAVMALGLYGNQRGGVGSQPSPSATAVPTVPPPSATPRADADGDLAPGTYVLHPLRPNDSLAVTFTVPEGWGAAFGTALIPSGDSGYAPPDGMAILFENVATLNGDPCDWLGTADDVSVGPAVDDLVEALRAQTGYEVSDPVDVTIGGYSGKRVDIVVPTEPFPGQSSDAPECDRGNYRLWSTVYGDEAGIYVQGPADRWQTNILDVEGTRLVIVSRSFPGTSPADRAEMDAILDSFVIDP
jgi:hypothetical protein